MPYVIRSSTLFGIIVFLGACMYFLVNSFTLRNCSRFIIKNTYSQDFAFVSMHEGREKSRFITNGLEMSTQGYMHNVNMRPMFQTTSHNPKDPIFHVNEYNITDETLDMVGYLGQNNSTSLVRLKGLSNLLSLIKPYIKQDNKLKHIYLPHKHVFHYTRLVTDVNCNAIFQGDKDEIKRAENITQVRNFLQPNNYSEMTKNCSHFKRQRGYIEHHLTEVEREFPIAFSILMFKDIAQSERLLRVIYRPQNYYCIHVDSKTDQTLYDGMSSIASCFENVLMTSTRFNVQWGTMTVLEPELLCMQELWNKKYSVEIFYKSDWTGVSVENKLRTRANFRGVQWIKRHRGAIKKSQQRSLAASRCATSQHHGDKGANHVVVNRGFVEFILRDQRAHDLLNWTRHTEVPDETFFATLNHNHQLGVPGAYLGEPETDDVIKPYMARFKNWGERECHGKYVHGICIIGTGDLLDLAHSKKALRKQIPPELPPLWLRLS